MIVRLCLSILCAATVITLQNSSAFAGTSHVPSQYPTIQAAIDASGDGDTIIVAPGTYYEHIDFNEMSLTLTSTAPDDPNVVAATILDANGSGRAVTFPETDINDLECTLSGFTITGGNSLEGGGIHCDGANRTVVITNSVITGNTAGEGGGIFDYDNYLQLRNCTLIQNSTTNSGGGMVNERGRADLTNCTFDENSAGYDGGGIYTRTGTLTLTDCTLHGNSSGNDGGGIGCDQGTVTTTNCTFSGNSADHWGGGLYNSHNATNAMNCTFSLNSAEDGGAVCTKHLHLGYLRLSNCTFQGNSADRYGGAVCHQNQTVNNTVSDMTLTNCILWGNSALEGPQVALLREVTASISYCCLQGGELDVYAPSAEVNWPGGYIDDDPCFADETGGDYHLQSSAGRWDANAGIWITDDNNSPCIDTGDPNSDWADELWPHGKRINMGAFGGTPQASMSESDVGNIADLDFSGFVNWGDLKILTNEWVVEELLLSEDLNRDGIVNWKDHAILVDNWDWEE
jgi:predicted outer membrane repeat protein